MEVHIKFPSSFAQILPLKIILQTSYETKITCTVPIILQYYITNIAKHLQVAGGEFKNAKTGILD